MDWIDWLALIVIVTACAVFEEWKKWYDARKDMRGFE